MDGLEAAKKSIVNSRSIAISGHINPDGDSIGSLLSLGLGLGALGKKVYMISPDGVPDRYRSLPGAGMIIRRLNKPVDLAIAVDCSNKEILGSAYEAFSKTANILEIDHHDFRRPFGNIRMIDKKAAAVGELVYLLLNKLNINFTRQIAQNLMTSIIVETNSFGLPNVRPFTFEVCTKLMNKGINFYKLVDTVFWSKRRESAILSGICLERCKFTKGGRLAWSIIRKKDFRKVGGKDEDVDSVPDSIRAIRNVRVALLLREKSAKTLRVSLRSKEGINVAGIAEHYGGGGHFDVAGCSIPNNVKSVRRFLKQAAELV